jgi:hypothetical protein
MTRATWPDELNGLLARFSGMGTGVDIAAVGLCELWSVYCFLRRLAEAYSMGRAKDLALKAAKEARGGGQFLPFRLDVLRSQALAD